jgi:nicotinamide-nucleotide amidase
MRAAILSIGDELALGQTLDTNSQWLAARLVEQSISVIEHRTIADDQHAIAQAIMQLSQRVEVLLITGGLGPTADDLTREALAEAQAAGPGSDLVTDVQAMQVLEQWFAHRSRSMPAINRKQAQRPRNMTLMPNPHGTAPGLAGEMGTTGGTHQCQVFAMPGPPREMQPMFLGIVLPAIRRPANSADDPVILTGVVQQFGMGESAAAELLGPLMQRDRNPLVGTTVSESIVAARIRATGPREDMETALRATIDEIEQRWHPYAFGRDGATLPDAVGSLMRAAGSKLVTAESCTGGWLGKVIVDRPKSSDIYLGGWVTYSNEFKNLCLNVSTKLIDTYGAVSAQVARAMAEGALHASGAEYSLAITGIAGPDGGTENKPVGTVFIALGSHAKNKEPTFSTRLFLFPGDRSAVRDRSVKAALQMLRFELMHVGNDHPLIWEVLATQKSTERELNQPHMEHTSR